MMSSSKSWSNYFDIDIVLCETGFLCWANGMIEVATPPTKKKKQQKKQVKQHDYIRYFTGAWLLDKCKLRKSSHTHDLRMIAVGILSMHEFSCLADYKQKWEQKSIVA